MLWARRLMAALALVGLACPVQGTPAPRATGSLTPIPTSYYLRGPTNQPVSGAVALFSVPADLDPSAYSASIAWPDGTQSAGTLALVPDGPGIDLQVSGSHSFAAAGLYRVSVTLTPNAGGPAVLDQHSAFIMIRPDAVTDLAATPGLGQVRLSWTPPPGATFYTVNRGTTPGGETGLASFFSPPYSFVDTTAVPGITYYYDVQPWVFADGDTSGLSNEVVSSPLPATGPALALRLRRAGQFRPGQIVRYLILLRNLGDAPTDSDIVVDDTIPAGTTFVGAQATGGGSWQCALLGTGRTYRCTWPAGNAPIQAGGSLALALQVAIPPDIAHPAILVESVAVSTASDTGAGRGAARLLVRVP